MSLLLGTSFAVAVPWIFLLRRSSFSRSTTISILLLIHTLFVLRALLARQPPNLFSTLQIPLNTPTDTVRALLLRVSSTPDLDPELEGLLVRLASFEGRSLYLRFGHNILATCTYCHSTGDFALYALPRAVLSYIREITFIGFVAPHRRKLGAIILVFMGLGEAYLLATVTIQIPQRGEKQPVIMWHDILLTIRHIVFLAFPLIMHFVAAPTFRIPFIYTTPQSNLSPIDTAAVLLQTQQSLAHLLPALHLLKYAQAATMRTSALRAQAGGWWEEEARVGALIRGDGEGMGEGGVNVRSIARGLDLSFDEARGGREEGKLLSNAKAAVRELFNDGIKVSGHWVPTS